MGINAHTYGYSLPPSTARLHAPTHPPGVNNSTEFDSIPLSLTDTSPIYRYVMCFFPIPSMTAITSITTTLHGYVNINSVATPGTLTIPYHCQILSLPNIHATMPPIIT